MKNPFAPDRWFYFCPDAPHGLKQFRDHCLDKGYILPKNPYDRRPRKHPQAVKKR